MPADHSYVRVDEHGAMRVGETDVMLDSVIAAYEQGHSPESIRAQFPGLRLRDVYGAITWCLEHPAEVEAYQKAQDARWTELRSSSDASAAPVVRRLREARGAGARVRSWR